MSGKLPRSTQYGKKLYLSNFGDSSLIIEKQRDGNTTSLSPFLGQSIVQDQNTFSHKCNSQKKPSKESYKPIVVDSTFSSLSDIESWDTGSTSSSSWFDEFDQGATVQLNKELNDIELVLYGEADISLLKTELHEECQEWIDAFPHLRVIGTGVKYSKINPTNKTTRSTNPNYSQLNYNPHPFPEGKSFSVLSTNTGSKRYYSNKASLSKSRHFNAQPDENNESFLRISPMSCREMRRSNFAPSILRSEMTSSKWCQQSSSSPEYSSLPFILPTSSRSNRFTQSSSASNNSSQMSSAASLEMPRKCLEPLPQSSFKKIRNVKSSNYYQTLEGQTTKSFILPPIDQLAIDDSRNKQHRSISATPRQFPAERQIKRPLPLSVVRQSAFYDNSGAIKKDLDKNKSRSNNSK